MAQASIDVGAFVLSNVEKGAVVAWALAWK